MNKTLILGLAAAILAGTTNLTPAFAGGGIRLSFNGPIGSFVARPSRGSYAPSAYSSNSSRSSSGYAAAKCKKAPSVAARSERHEPKVASRSYDDDKPSARSVKRVSKDATTTYVKPRSRRSVEKDEVAEENEVTTSATTALIETDAKKDTVAETPAVEAPAAPAPVAETPAAEAQTTTVAAATPAEQAAQPAEAAPVTIETTTETAPPLASEPLGPPAPVVEETEKPKKSTKTAKKDDCKKFIPSVGVTISVGC